MNPFNIEQNEKTSRSKQFRCCVAGCKTRSSNGFHNFPTNRKVCLEWMQKTGKQDWDVDKIPKSFHKVCKNHFESNDFEINMNGKKRLRKGAVPSQSLRVYVPADSIFVS